MKRIRQFLAGTSQDAARSRVVMTATLLAAVLLAGLAACFAIAGDGHANSRPAEQSSRNSKSSDTASKQAESLADSVTKHEGVLRKDLVVYYSFDDDANGKVYDESGHKNHGAAVGNVGYEPSFRGRAARFTSSGTYVLSESAGLNTQGWTQASVSVWIKTNRLTTYGNILNRGEVTGDTPSGIALRAGGDWCKAYFSIQRQYQTNPAVAEHLYSSSLQPRHMDRVGKWVHLAGTFDGDFLRLYVNGKLDREMEASSHRLHLWDRPEYKLVIGNSSLKSRMAWSDKYFDGLIDEVKIWKRGLTAKEVEQLHAEGERAIDGRDFPVERPPATPQDRKKFQ